MSHGGAKKSLACLCQVWIHGGSNLETGPDWAAFEGSKLVARSTVVPADGSEAVIMVAIGYRLGGLGFMAMPELTAESSENSSGNYGLLDQIFALKWIKRNIHSFGASADPKVMVFGESAGAYDVSILLASPLAAGLFDGAILQSPYQAYLWTTLAESEKTGSACAAAHKCQKDDAAATLECMRNLTALEAYLCQTEVYKPTSNILQHQSFPNVDGSVLVNWICLFLLGPLI